MTKEEEFVSSVLADISYLITTYSSINLTNVYTNVLFSRKLNKNFNPAKLYGKRSSVSLVFAISLLVKSLTCLGTFLFKVTKSSIKLAKK